MSEEKAQGQKRKLCQDVWVYIVDVHYMDENNKDIPGSIYTFDSEENANLFLAQVVCDCIKHYLKVETMDDDVNKLFCEIVANKTSSLETVDKTLESYKGDSSLVRRIRYILFRSRPRASCLNQGLLKYTSPKPEQEWDFDMFVHGLAEISKDMNRFVAEFGHTNQDTTDADIIRQMHEHVKTLESMLAYQEYLALVDPEEGECAYLNIGNALKMAKSLCQSLDNCI